MCHYSTLHYSYYEKELKTYRVIIVISCIFHKMDSQFSQYVSYSMDVSIKSPNVRSKLYNSVINEKTITYQIMTNDSSMISDDNSVLRNYRSVVFSKDTGNVVSFSPTTSIPMHQFIDENPTPMQNHIIINEIIEGTMINLFYDPALNRWEIATRGSIGGNYWFFRNEYIINGETIHTTPQLTFRQLFMDALKANIDSQLNDNMILNELPTQYCYSFVVQHPSNHIVLSVDVPHLYLVGVYECMGNQVNVISANEYEAWECFRHFDGVIEFPSRISGNYEYIRNMICSETSPYKMGAMFFNTKTGSRSSMENPIYEMLKKLRGNNPNLQYQFFCLLRAGMAESFLEYFPMYKKIFAQFNKQYQDFITNVHQSYFSYYVRKEGIPISKKYFIHVSRIHHDIYLPSLATEKIIISRPVVKNYFDGKEPSELLYYMNYDKRAMVRPVEDDYTYYPIEYEL